MTSCTTSVAPCGSLSPACTALQSSGASGTPCRGEPDHPQQFPMSDVTKKFLSGHAGAWVMQVAIPTQGPRGMCSEKEA